VLEGYVTDDMLTLDLTDLDNGVYLLTSVSDGVVSNQRIVKN